MHDKNKAKIKWNIILLMIALCSISIRLLMHYRFDQSALLYIAVPFCIALILTWLVKPNPNKSWKKQFFNLSIISLIIMLGSSIVLFEGFICVIMFMPIYFFVIFLVFIFKYLSEKFRDRKTNQLFSHVLPIILILSAFEGTHPELSIQRHNTVLVTQIIDSNIEQIMNKLNAPIYLQKDRDWFLELFPMPYKIKATNLRKGEVHEIYFRYHRWFITNTQEGSMKMKIENVEHNQIETSFVADTSYIAKYLKLKSLKLKFIPITHEKTQIEFSISYERLLDPAWYFDPLQRYGVTKSIEFLLDEVVNPYEN